MRFRLQLDEFQRWGARDAVIGVSKKSRGESSHLCEAPVLMVRAQDVTT